MTTESFILIMAGSLLGLIAFFGLLRGWGDTRDEEADEQADESGADRSLVPGQVGARLVCMRPDCQRSQLMTRAEVEEAALGALGRIIIPLFQEAGTQYIADRGRVPDYDYLIPRDGQTIGYSELTERYAAALAEELDARG